jgi:hypothetical protein
MRETNAYCIKQIAIFSLIEGTATIYTNAHIMNNKSYF